MGAQPCGTGKLFRVCVCVYTHVYQLHTHQPPPPTPPFLQVLQPDETTVLLDMRSLQHRAWLRISWHPVRASISAIPNASTLDASRAAIFSFGTQLHGMLRGLVLRDVIMPEPWERVARLDFAERPEGDVVRSVIVEVMGKTSNVVVVDAQGRIVLCAYQVV